MFIIVYIPNVFYRRNNPTIVSSLNTYNTVLKVIFYSISFARELRGVVYKMFSYYPNNFILVPNCLKLIFTS